MVLFTVNKQCLAHSRCSVFSESTSLKVQRQDCSWNGRARRSRTREDEPLWRKWMRDKEPLQELTGGEWGSLQLTHVLCDLGSEIWQVLSEITGF